MDLAALDLTAKADEGAWLTVKHPVTGDDLPIRIRLAGQDSARWREAMREYSDKRLQQMQKRGRVGAPTTKEVEERGVRLLAAATIAWEGVEWEGSPLACSEHAARTVYRKLGWLAEQVDEFISDRANFAPASEGGEKQPGVFDAEAVAAGVEGNSSSGASGASA